MKITIFKGLSSISQCKSVAMSRITKITPITNVLPGIWSIYMTLVRSTLNILKTTSSSIDGCVSYRILL